MQLYATNWAEITKSIEKYRWAFHDGILTMSWVYQIIPTWLGSTSIYNFKKKNAQQPGFFPLLNSEFSTIVVPTKLDRVFVPDIYTKKKNKHLVIQSDLFGMVKWPFQGVKWPPTRGWKGHFESPGRVFFIAHLLIDALDTRQSKVFGGRDEGRLVSFFGFIRRIFSSKCSAYQQGSGNKNSEMFTKMCAHYHFHTTVNLKKSNWWMLQNFTTSSNIFLRKPPKICKSSCLSPTSKLFLHIWLQTTHKVPLQPESGDFFGVETSIRVEWPSNWCHNTHLWLAELINGTFLYKQIGSRKGMCPWKTGTFKQLIAMGKSTTSIC